MFKEEAIWIKGCLSVLRPQESNKFVANIGSSTRHFRKIIQPHIQENIINQLEQNGWRIINIDLKKEEGVDIVADVSDENFGLQFPCKFALVICTNMLEHIENISIVIKNILSVAEKNAYLIITVPYKYKIHHDPIDNGLRPTPEEIFSLFPFGSVKHVFSKVITIKDKYYYKIKKSKIPLWGYRDRLMFYFGKRYKVSGIVLKFQNDG